MESIWEVKIHTLENAPIRRFYFRNFDDIIKSIEATWGKKEVRKLNTDNGFALWEYRGSPGRIAVEADEIPSFEILETWKAFSS